MERASHSKSQAVAVTARQRPRREDLLLPVLEGTGRDFVPLRSAFVQKPRGTPGVRGATLAKLTRDSFALDAYLLIHALASSSEPYVAAYPAATWVQLARLDEGATFAAAKARWSKLVTRLSLLRLIERERKGNQMQYRLLDESGDGRPYTRPKDAGDRHWLKLPYSYWALEFDSRLDHPEKLMLLIALDQRKQFRLPLNQVPNWYGISEATARRGLRGLESRSLLSKTTSFVASPRSPSGWEETFTYSLLGPFSIGAATDTRVARKSTTRRIGDPEAPQV